MEKKDTCPIVELGVLSAHLKKREEKKKKKKERETEKNKEKNDSPWSL